MSDFQTFKHSCDDSKRCALCLYVEATERRLAAWDEKWIQVQSELQSAEQRAKYEEKRGDLAVIWSNSAERRAARLEKALLEVIDSLEGTEDRDLHRIAEEAREALEEK